MSYHIETVLRSMPGVALCEMDAGGMIIDRNTGEYVEAGQIIMDPDHLWQFDCFDEGHLGCLKLGLCSDDSTCADEDEDDEELVEDNTPIGHFMNEQEELSALITQQEADMAASHTTCTKGRHGEFGEEKPDNRWRGVSHGFRGRQINKDRRLRAKGSSKTRAPNAIW